MPSMRKRERKGRGGEEEREKDLQYQEKTLKTKSSLEQPQRETMRLEKQLPLSEKASHRASLQRTAQHCKAFNPPDSRVIYIHPAPNQVHSKDALGDPAQWWVVT